MNNSFPRLIDGMCATLRTEVLPRLDDEFARGQVFGVINLLNTFKARADWSAGFLVEQIGAQRAAVESVVALVKREAGGVSLPPLPYAPQPLTTPIADLLALRDQGNRAIGDLLRWLDEERGKLSPEAAAQAEQLLRKAMLVETAIELKNSPRPLFAEMSSGKEE
jgi:hypothetical protein